MDDISNEQDQATVIHLHNFSTITLWRVQRTVVLREHRTEVSLALGLDVDGAEPALPRRRRSVVGSRPSRGECRSYRTAVPCSATSAPAAPKREIQRRQYGAHSTACGRARIADMETFRQLETFRLTAPVSARPSAGKW